MVTTHRSCSHVPASKNVAYKAVTLVQDLPVENRQRQLASASADLVAAVVIVVAASMCLVTAFAAP